MKATLASVRRSYAEMLAARHGVLPMDVLDALRALEADIQDLGREEGVAAA